MRLNYKISLVAASMMLAVITGLPAIALGAKNTHTNAETTTEQPETTTEGTSHEGGKKGGSKDGKKLAEAKLKVCQKKEKHINDKMGRISDRGQKQLALFSSIAEKTEKFYADKGNTLSNYDALVADVAAKKADAQAAVDATKSTTTTFKCDGTDPKGAVSSFKDALKSEIAALKAYKTSVKNLIVGVKSVNGKTTSTESKTTEDKTTTGGTQ